MEYMIVEGDLHQITEAANTLLKDGWLPQGGPFNIVDYMGTIRKYGQAFTRNKE